MTELLAIHEAVKHFRHMLEARHFVIYTDHKPLTYAFSQKLDKCSPRQFNHLDFISQFTTDIRHISGQDNVVADALSCVEAVCASSSPEALAEEQANDAEFTALLHGTTPSETTPVRPLNRPAAGVQLSTVLATLEQEQQENSSPNVSCGWACRRTAVPGHEHVCLASGRRYPGTSPHLWETSFCLNPDCSTFTSVSLAYSRHQMFSDALWH